MTDIKEMKNINEYESAEAFYKEYPKVQFMTNKMWNYPRNQLFSY